MPWDCLATFGLTVGKKDPQQAHLPQWPLKLSMISPLSPYFITGRSYCQLTVRHSPTGISWEDPPRTSAGHCCPHLDGSEFAQCLSEIIRLNGLRILEVVWMDAPCCKRMTDTVMSVIRKSGKDIPLQFVTVGTVWNKCPMLIIWKNISYRILMKLASGHRFHTTIRFMPFVFVF